MCLKKGAPAPPPKGECGEALRTSTTAAYVWFISAATATTASVTYTAASTTACSWP
jgi:hypothetical protein